MAMQQGKLSPQEEGATLLSSYLSFLEEASKNGDFFSILFSIILSIHCLFSVTLLLPREVAWVVSLSLLSRTESDTPSSPK